MPVSRRTEVTLMALILLVALFFRVWQLDVAPPGHHHDDVMDIQIARWITQGYHAIYFPEAYGHEPLYAYLMAGWILLFGHAYPWIRLLSVLIGLLGILTAYLAARRLFGVPVALLTAVGLALSLWHILFSRRPIRAITLPFFVALTVYCFWRGIMGQGDRGTGRQGDGGTGRQGTCWLALGGLLLGLSFYTYMASRVMPGIYLGFVAYMALFHREQLRGRWPGIVAFFVIAALVATPLAVYLLTHPAAEVRSAQVNAPLTALLHGNPGPVLRNAWAVLGMFGVRGDQWWELNPPYRPVFGEPVGAVLFYLGLGLCLWRWRRPAYALALIWLGVGVLPSVLTADAPNFPRCMGALPVIYAFPALASWQVCKFASTQVRKCAAFQPFNLPILPLVAILLWLSITAADTYHDYFLGWARRDDVRFAYQAGLTQAALYINNHPQVTRAAASGLSNFEMDPYTFQTILQRPDPETRWFDSRSALVFPDGGAETTYFLPTIVPFAPQLQERFWTEATLLEELRLPGNYVACRVYRLEARALLDEKIAALSRAPVWVSDVSNFSPDLPPDWRKPLPLPVDFDHRLQFLGYELLGDRAISPGQGVHLLTYWRVTASLTPPLKLFVHILDQESRVVVGHDAFDVGVASLRPGDVVVQLHPLPIPKDTAPGVYQVEIGVYHPDTMQRLSIYDGEAVVADRLLLEPIEIK